MSAEALNQQFIYIPRAALIASFILHLMIPTSWLAVKALESMGIQIFPKTHVQDIYQEYVQVDLVGLPDVAVKDLEKLDATLPEVDKPAEVKEEEKEDDTMALEAQEKALKEKEKAEKEAKAKKLAEEEKKKALKQIEEELKREQALKNLAKDGKHGRQKLKGNILAKGNAVVGAMGTPKDQYTAIIMAKIKDKFFVMPSQLNKGLTNTIHLELFPTGRVRAKRFVKKSADQLFDSAIMAAVDEAQPFPIPEDLSLINGGITVTFRPEE